MQRTARDLALCKQRAVHGKAQAAVAATAGPLTKRSKSVNLPEGQDRAPRLAARRLSAASARAGGWPFPARPGGDETSLGGSSLASGG